MMLRKLKNLFLICSARKTALHYKISNSLKAQLTITMEEWGNFLNIYQKSQINWIT